MQLRSYIVFFFLTFVLPISCFGADANEVKYTKEEVLQYKAFIGEINSISWEKLEEDAKKLPQQNPDPTLEEKKKRLWRETVARLEQTTYQRLEIDQLVNNDKEELLRKKGAALDAKGVDGQKKIEALQKEQKAFEGNFERKKKKKWITLLKNYVLKQLKKDHEEKRLDEKYQAVTFYLIEAWKEVMVKPVEDEVKGFEDQIAEWKGFIKHFNTKDKEKKRELAAYKKELKGLQEKKQQVQINQKQQQIREKEKELRVNKETIQVLQNNIASNKVKIKKKKKLVKPQKETLEDLERYRDAFCKRLDDKFKYYIDPENDHRSYEQRNRFYSQYVAYNPHDGLFAELGKFFVYYFWRVFKPEKATEVPQAWSAIFFAENGVFDRLKEAPIYEKCQKTVADYEKWDMGEIFETKIEVRKVDVSTAPPKEVKALKKNTREGYPYTHYILLEKINNRHEDDESQIVFADSKVSGHVAFYRKGKDSAKVYLFDGNILDPLYTLETGKITQPDGTFSTERVNALQFSYNNEYLFVGETNRIRLIKDPIGNIENGKKEEIVFSSANFNKGFILENSLKAVFSPDGKYVTVIAHENPHFAIIKLEVLEKEIANHGSDANWSPTFSTEECHTQNFVTMCKESGEPVVSIKTTQQDPFDQVRFDDLEDKEALNTLNPNEVKELAKLRLISEQDKEQQVKDRERLKVLQAKKNEEEVDKDDKDKDEKDKVKLTREEQTEFERLKRIREAKSEDKEERMEMPYEVSRDGLEIDAEWVLKKGYNGEKDRYVLVTRNSSLGGLKVWDPETGMNIQTHDVGLASIGKLLPNAKVVITVGNSTIIIKEFNLENAKEFISKEIIIERNRAKSNYNEYHTYDGTFIFMENDEGLEIYLNNEMIGFLEKEDEEIEQIMITVTPSEDGTEKRRNVVTIKEFEEGEMGSIRVYPVGKNLKNRILQPVGKEVEILNSPASTSFFPKKMLTAPKKLTAEEMQGRNYPYFAHAEVKKLSVSQESSCFASYGEDGLLKYIDFNKGELLFEKRYKSKDSQKISESDEEDEDKRNAILHPVQDIAAHKDPRFIAVGRHGGIENDFIEFPRLAAKQEKDLKKIAKKTLDAKMQKEHPAIYNAVKNEGRLEKALNDSVASTVKLAIQIGASPKNVQRAIREAKSVDPMVINENLKRIVEKERKAQKDPSFVLKQPHNIRGRIRTMQWIGNDLYVVYGGTLAIWHINTEENQFSLRCIKQGFNRIRRIQSHLEGKYVSLLYQDKKRRGMISLLAPNFLENDMYSIRGEKIHFVSEDKFLIEQGDILESWQRKEKFGKFIFEYVKEEDEDYHERETQKEAKGMNYFLAGTQYVHFDDNMGIVKSKNEKINGKDKINGIIPYPKRKFLSFHEEEETPIFLVENGIMCTPKQTIDDLDKEQAIKSMYEGFENIPKYRIFLFQVQIPACEFTDDNPAKGTSDDIKNVYTVLGTWWEKFKKENYNPRKRGSQADQLQAAMRKPENFQLCKPMYFILQTEVEKAKHLPSQYALKVRAERKIEKILSELNLVNLEQLDDCLSSMENLINFEKKAKNKAEQLKQKKIKFAIKFWEKNTAQRLKMIENIRKEDPKIPQSPEALKIYYGDDKPEADATEMDKYIGNLNTCYTMYINLEFLFEEKILGDVPSIMNFEKEYLEFKESCKKKVTNKTYKTLEEAILKNLRDDGYKLYNQWNDLLKEEVEMDKIKSNKLIKFIFAWESEKAQNELGGLTALSKVNGESLLDLLPGYPDHVKKHTLEQINYDNATALFVKYYTIFSKNALHDDKKLFKLKREYEILRKRYPAIRDILNHWSEPVAYDAWQKKIDPIIFPQFLEDRLPMNDNQNKGHKIPLGNIAIKWSAYTQAKKLSKMSAKILNEKVGALASIHSAIPMNDKLILFQKIGNKATITVSDLKNGNEEFLIDQIEQGAPEGCLGVIPQHKIIAFTFYKTEEKKQYIALLSLDELEKKNPEINTFKLQSVNDPIVSLQGTSEGLEVFDKNGRFYHIKLKNGAYESAAELKPKTGAYQHTFGSHGSMLFTSLWTQQQEKIEDPIEDEDLPKDLQAVPKPPKDEDDKKEEPQPPNPNPRGGGIMQMLNSGLNNFLGGIGVLNNAFNSQNPNDQFPRRVRSKHKREPIQKIVKDNRQKKINNNLRNFKPFSAAKGYISKLVSDTPKQEETMAKLKIMKTMRDRMQLMANDFDVVYLDRQKRDFLKDLPKAPVDYMYWCFIRTANNTKVDFEKEYLNNVTSIYKRIKEEIDDKLDERIEQKDRLITVKHQKMYSEPYQENYIELRRAVVQRSNIMQNITRNLGYLNPNYDRVANLYNALQENTQLQENQINRIEEQLALQRIGGIDIKDQKEVIALYKKQIGRIKKRDQIFSKIDLALNNQRNINLKAVKEDLAFMKMLGNRGRSSKKKQWRIDFLQTYAYYAEALALYAARIENASYQVDDKEISARMFGIKKFFMKDIIIELYAEFERLSNLENFEPSIFRNYGYNEEKVAKVKRFYNAIQSYVGTKRKRKVMLSQIPQSLVNDHIEAIQDLALALADNVYKDYYNALFDPLVVIQDELNTPVRKESLGINLRQQINKQKNKKPKEDSKKAQPKGKKKKKKKPKKAKKPKLPKIIAEKRVGSIVDLKSTATVTIPGATALYFDDQEKELITICKTNAQKNELKIWRYGTTYHEALPIDTFPLSAPFFSAKSYDVDGVVRDPIHKDYIYFLAHHKTSKKLATTLVKKNIKTKEEEVLQEGLFTAEGNALTLLPDQGLLMVKEIGGVKFFDTHQSSLSEKAKAHKKEIRMGIAGFGLLVTGTIVINEGKKYYTQKKKRKQKEERQRREREKEKNKKTKKRRKKRDFLI